MRAHTLKLAVAGAVLLVPALAHPSTAYEGTVSADDLLATVRSCTRISNGGFRSDADAPADIPVCGTRGAVFWKADMDIDCDGRPGARCNEDADPSFTSTTAYLQSDGRHLSAERTPFIVVPGASGRWNYRDYGIRGGSVAAVIYRGRVQYAVVGDVGPAGIIGEASYATAEQLGINPDPRRGGTASGVTYILFKWSQVSPIEDHAGAVAEGERLARWLVQQG